jgi:hypothetical protein
MHCHIINHLHGIEVTYSGSQKKRARSPDCQMAWGWSTAQVVMGRSWSVAATTSLIPCWSRARQGFAPVCRQTTTA